MDLASLLSYIDQNINTKYGVDKINGKLHNAVMRQVVSSLIEITATGFGGDLSPEQNPGTQTKPIYFMATETGTFTYCGGVEVTTIPAFVMWTGSAWSAKNIGLPQGVGEASKCQGLVFANDLQPSGKAVGDWYVFMGGGSINWGTAISSAGIVYLKSNTPSDSWGYVPFGGDARFRGIIDPGFDPTSIVYSNGDYYIARTGGDFSKFAGINIDSIKVTGKLTYNASSKNWTFSEFTGGGSYFEIDEVPTDGSVNAVQSGGVKAELDKKLETVAITGDFTGDGNSASKLAIAETWTVESPSDYEVVTRPYAFKIESVTAENGLTVTLKNYSDDSLYTINTNLAAFAKVKASGDVFGKSFTLNVRPV